MVTTSYGISDYFYGKDYILNSSNNTSIFVNWEGIYRNIDEKLNNMRNTNVLTQLEYDILTKIIEEYKTKNNHKQSSYCNSYHTEGLYNEY